MESSAWITLMRIIPPEQHDNLAIMPLSGVEINVQSILRTEAEFMVIRGRLSGTTDSGRIFFVPYDQINFLNFQKPLKEPDVHAMFGGAPGTFAPAPLPGAKQAAAPPGPAEEEELATEATEPQPPTACPCDGRAAAAGADPLGRQVGHPRSAARPRRPKGPRWQVAGKR